MPRYLAPCRVPCAKRNGAQCGTHRVDAHVAEQRVPAGQVRLVPFVERAYQHAAEKTNRRHATTPLTACVADRGREHRERYGVHHFAPWPREEAYCNRLSAANVQAHRYAYSQQQGSDPNGAPD